MPKSIQTPVPQVVPQQEEAKERTDVLISVPFVDADGELHDDVLDEYKLLVRQPIYEFAQRIANFHKLDDARTQSLILTLVSLDAQRLKKPRREVTGKQTRDRAAKLERALGIIVDVLSGTGRNETTTALFRATAGTVNIRRATQMLLGAAVELRPFASKAAENVLPEDQYHRMFGALDINKQDAIKDLAEAFAKATGKKASLQVDNKYAPSDKSCMAFVIGAMKVVFEQSMTPNAVGAAYRDALMP